MVPRSTTSPFVGTGAGIALGLAPLPPERTVNFAPTPATRTTATMTMSLPLPFFLTSPSSAGPFSFAMAAPVFLRVWCGGRVGEDHNLDPAGGGPALRGRGGGGGGGLAPGRGPRAWTGGGRAGPG